MRTQASGSVSSGRVRRESSSDLYAGVPRRGSQEDLGIALAAMQSDAAGAGAYGGGPMSGGVRGGVMPQSPSMGARRLTGDGSVSRGMTREASMSGGEDVFGPGSQSMMHPGIPEVLK